MKLSTKRRLAFGVGMGAVVALSILTYYYPTLLIIELAFITASKINQFYAYFRYLGGMYKTNGFILYLYCQLVNFLCPKEKTDAPIPTFNATIMIDAQVNAEEVNDPTLFWKELKQNTYLPLSQNQTVIIVLKPHPQPVEKKVDVAPL